MPKNAQNISIKIPSIKIIFSVFLPCQQEQIMKFNVGEKKKEVRN